MEDITLIVTCHNQHIYLTELCSYISECKNRGWRFEVIILDSSDNEYSPLIECKYVRIPNLGPSVARNHGASLSTKEWLLFCDADDFFNPRVFEVFERNSLLKENNLICFEFIRVQNKNGIYSIAVEYLNNLGKNQKVKIGKIDSPIYFIDNFRPVHAVIIRRQVFESISFDSEQWYVEDVNFYLQCFKIDPTKCIKITSGEFISVHRDFEDNTSLSRINNNAFWAGVAKNYNYINNQFKLSIIERFRLIKNVIVSLKSLEENIKIDFLKRTKNLLESNKLIYFILRVEFLMITLRYAKRILISK
jgi:glycosyltransferase involved in cell wall biosynthesis